ncbi:hypothetical protein PTTG_28923 [Puccinia triticina 1-1 BBBD Race 1]|uniref:Uncharacterized protein n=1 Tax=Puccinia triticina (isolate 1-1 / race 1 (BBBD)) TaxID=630390 RepID=A0A180G824_PUCT1|nr:hypothetical protein PTTG_28923 [Puccinia triticina 1-1 BBBD Race 1]
METDIPDLNSDHDSENSKTGSEVDDPQFPYRGGPGHPDASQETLKIMHEMLQEKGMRRFRLDVSSPLSATDNRFCLNVARNIFVQLVECGEYDGLKPDEKDPENILRHLTSYAKERFFRKYRERTTWTSEQQAQKTKSNLRRARRINLIKLRQETAVEIGGLEKFRSIIDKCTSDDETDDEAPVASTSTTRNERLKFCKVRLMAWRSEDVKKAMILLDQYREEKQAGKPNKRIGVQPRIRRRADQNVVHSKIEPPEGSSRDIYDKNWLELQNQETILSLKISSRLVMPGVLQVLNRAIPQN